MLIFCPRNIFTENIVDMTKVSLPCYRWRWSTTFSDGKSSLEPRRLTWSGLCVVSTRFSTGWWRSCVSVRTWLREPYYSRSSSRWPLCEYNISSQDSRLPYMLYSGGYSTSVSGLIINAFTLVFLYVTLSFKFTFTSTLLTEPLRLIHMIFKQTVCKLCFATLQLCRHRMCTNYPNKCYKYMLKKIVYTLKNISIEIMCT